MEGLNNSSSVHIMSNIKFREQFVTGLNGTSIGEILLFASQIPLFSFVTIFFELSILNRFNINLYTASSISICSATLIFIIEVFTIIVPLLCMFTVLSDLLTLVLLFILITIFIIITYSVSSPHEHVYYWKLPHFRRSAFPELVLLGKQPFITYFRSLVFIATAISILAVDFNVYPRRFAKTETYGVSLMDLGVGFFVISNALVLKTNVALGQGLRKTLSESSVCLILGVFRYLLLQHLDYQIHVSEYGVHWNFFITLAFVKLFSYVLLQMSRGYSLICGFAVLVIHQYLLSFSLETYVLSNEGRDDWFNANREGIISLCGYTSLYLIGIALASFVNPEDKKLNTRKKVNILIMLITISISLFFISYYFNSIDFKVSRRLANLPYVTWVITVSIAVLALCLIVELLAICFLPIPHHLKNKIYFLLTPAMLDSVNSHGLLFFLISNLLTGFVNINIGDFHLETSRTMFLLFMYMFVNCAVVFYLYLNGVQLKCL